MKTLPKYFIYIALLSLLLGFIAKILNVDFTGMGISVVYPIHPKSFLEFSNTLFLAAIAIKLAFPSSND